MAKFEKKTAYKLKIGDLVKGQYVKREGWEPSYIIGRNGIEISRVNILALVVGIEESNPEAPSIIIDDGSGKVEVRAFGDQKFFETFNIGDSVLVIGRPREYNNEIFITPEIVKKIENKKWLELRKLETNDKSIVEEKKSETQKEEKKEIPEPEVKEEEVIEEENPSQIIFRLIKEMDNGDGADHDEVIEKSGRDDAEKIISNLLVEGDIFEIKRGKLKVLE